jgi:gamma-glutamyltranspeptidase
MAGKQGISTAKSTLKKAFPPRRLPNSEVSCLFYSVSLASFNLDKEMGHDARQVSGISRGMFGRGQVIQRILDASGKSVWAAGSDPRADGHAAAQI